LAIHLYYYIFVQMKNDKHLLYILACIKLVIPFLLYNSYYQLHRDEYLYLAEGHHLAWGYLEVPPLLSVFAWLTNLLGGGFFWVKLWPNLFGAFTYILVGKMVLELGGKKFALLLAWLPFAVGGLMRLFFLLHPNFLDVFFWTLMAFGVFRYIKTKDNKWLYLFGASVGFGLLSKYSSVFYAASMLLGLLISRHRTVFTSKHLYLAGALALFIFLPNLLWQYNHHFPIVNHMEELQQEQLQLIQPGDFLKAQLMMNLPILFIWVGGLVFTVISERGKDFRVFAWAYSFVIILLLIGHGKDYYALGAYPVLIGLGAFYIEKLTSQYFKWTRVVMIVIPLALYAFAMPIVMPVFSPEKLAVYYKNTGLDKTGSMRWEDQQFHPIPQDFADMVGWKEMAEKAAKIYKSLPADEQKSTMIYARAYYSAGSLNYYGPSLGLPEVYSDDANFLFWMPKKYNIKNLLLVGHNMPNKDDAVFQQFDRVRVLDSINMPLFREHGMKFILFEKANDSANFLIEKSVSEQKAKFGE
jgi:hypothetical protein